MRTKLVLMALLVVVAAVFWSGCGGSGDSAAAGKKANFHCPMHPTYVSDRQGDCPICGMRLVRIKQEGAGSATGEQTDPGQANKAPKVPGRVMIMVSSERRQTIGLATSTVEPREFSQTIRTTAVVEHDETQLARVAPRFGGWIRKLHISYTGQEVRQGDPLFAVYSPELVTTETEYLLALAHLQRLTNAPPDQQADARGLLQSSRRRLELMQIGDQEIRAMEVRGRAEDELLIRAPVSGHVISKAAVEGKAFMPGETLYEIGDLDHVWLRASVAEKDLPTVAVGLKALVTLPSLANREFESKVSFIYPHIDPQTRRAEVRLELANTNHLIRPDMWANVEIRAELGKHLAVPASAVIDTGTRFIAFVDRSDLHLEPREVRIGARAEDHLQILEGLKEGEKVVTRALFLVDSESQLKAAIAAMVP